MTTIGTRQIFFYEAKAYKVAAKSYAAIYERHSTNARFLFEYGHALHKSNQYAASTAMLREATQWSGDPMIWNIMGKNYQAEEQYMEAEACYLRAMHRLPARIYPYYLLAKLYAEPPFYQPEKCRAMCDVVLHKKPKVDSHAVEEIKEEIHKLRKQITEKCSCGASY